MKLTVISTIGHNTTITASDAVFGVTPNPVLIAQAVRVYLSNQRQGTSKVKTRSEINRTKKKWFKQKGTGNARHGARTPNIFVGGGVAHGPNGEQNWSLTMTTAMRRKALASVLSAQVKNIAVSDDILQLDGKTASAQKMIAKMLPDAERVLVVVEKAEDVVARSVRNLPHVILATAAQVNTYAVALADGILMTRGAVTALEKRLTASTKATKSATTTAAAEVTTVEVAEKAPAKTAVKKSAVKAPAKKAAPKAAAKKPAKTAKKK